MPGASSIHELWNVPTDGMDWPIGLPAEEREPMVDLVRQIVIERQPIGHHDLYRAVSDRRDPRLPTFNRAALFDFLYACVERAARAASAYTASDLTRVERTWTIETCERAPALVRDLRAGLASLVAVTRAKEVSPELRAEILELIARADAYGRGERRPEPKKGRKSRASKATGPADLPDPISQEQRAELARQGRW